MEHDHIRSLLRRSESETLDFKRDQYPFVNATDEEKSELLKDILAFANAWKENDAYIVIGVSESDGRALAVVGAATLPNADIQQFVGAKVNRPLQFQVNSEVYEGLALTIIRINEQQDRPLFLVKRYGKLEAGVVYIRRGSSTDKADPDEIAEMGRSETRSKIAEKAPDIIVECEHLIYTERDDGIFGGAMRREPHDVEELRIYFRNTGQKVAQYVKGKILLPRELLFDYATHPLKIPRDLEGADIETFPVNNNLTPPRIHPFGKVHPPDWHPILPQEKLLVP
jgi:hypothetical protein